MPIKVALPSNSGFTPAILLGVIDYLTTEAIFSSATTTQITGSGLFGGSASSFVLNGTGFGYTTFGTDTFLTSGTLDSVVFTTTVAGTVTFDTVNVDMAIFAPIIFSDISGSAPLAIENFMLAQSWDFTLSDGDDIAVKGMLVVDGADFNLKGDDIVRGMGGDDDLYSGDGRDRLFGNSGKDRLDGGRGNDTVKGGSGNDRVLGSEGRDKLFGDGGKDVLKGGNQNDVLDGGAGRDVLFGGKGADRFVFRDGSGIDKVMDFDATNNKEDIDLRQLSTINGYQELKNNFMYTDGLDVVIDDGVGVYIRLVGVDLADLGKGDFLF
jgi:Ca2+-binding RTX toxin-like protein